MTPFDLRELIEGTRAIYLARGGNKTILKEEQPTIDFAYACVVAISDIDRGEIISTSNAWVKRPGTGEIKAEYFSKVLGMKARHPIRIDQQIRWSDLE
jgi:N-acetylneuraminate synthase